MVPGHIEAKSVDRRLSDGELCCGRGTTPHDVHGYTGGPARAQGGGPMSSRQERVHDQPTESVPADGTVLLLAPGIGGAEQAACTDIVTAHGLAETRVVHVLYAESPADRYLRFEDRVDGHPEATAVVPVGAGGISGARGPDPPREDYDVTPMSDPGDLTGLAMVMNEWLCRWADEPSSLTVCFDSLSILLQYADVDRIYRFVHTLTGHLSEYGASAHFHMDPKAHDEAVVARLAGLVDSVVEVDHHRHPTFQHTS
jgi:hypothetical protein